LCWQAFKYDYMLVYACYKWYAGSYRELVEAYDRRSLGYACSLYVKITHLPPVALPLRVYNRYGGTRLQGMLAGLFKGVAASVVYAIT
jgi:hypothetical protein